MSESTVAHCTSLVARCTSLVSRGFSLVSRCAVLVSRCTTLVSRFAAFTGPPARAAAAAAALTVAGLAPPAAAQLCNPLADGYCIASDGQMNDNYGFSVGIDGAWAVVGARYADRNGSASGSAYVLFDDGGGWAEQALLLPDDGQAGDVFGVSVAISGEVAVVGAHLAHLAGLEYGAAYVFRRAGTVWTQEAKLIASDGEPGDEFGWAVAIDGDTIVVGSHRHDEAVAIAGAVYVYHSNGNSWPMQAKLTANDATLFAELGFSVAIDGDRVVAGAFTNDTTAPGAGAAYVFARSAAVWTQEAKLVAADGDMNDLLGTAVAVSGGVIAVSAPRDDDEGLDAGAVYVFTENAGVWSQSAKLTGAATTAGDGFGGSLDMSGDTIVAGIPGDDLFGTEAGAATAFRFDGSAWIEQAGIRASFPAAFDSFGWAVSLSGDEAIVGAFNDDDWGPSSGSVSFFAMNCQCRADLTGDGALDFFDVQSFLAAFAASDPAADWNADGAWDFFDLLAFLADFAAGCP
jgi:FG-GAP repeat protein